MLQERHGRCPPEGESRPGPRLTGREAQVLRCLIDGQTNKQIARELDITVKTVEFHVSKLLRKYGVASRFELIDRLTFARDRVDEVSVSAVVGTKGHEAVIAHESLANASLWGFLWPRFFANAIRVLLRPSVGFPSLVTRPDVITPMVILAGSGIFFGMTFSSWTISSVTPWRAFLVLLGSLAAACATWFVVAAPIYMIGRSTKEHVPAEGVLSVAGYVLFPTAVRAISQGVVALFPCGVVSDPGSIVDVPATWSTWAQAFTSVLNVFNLWTVALMFLAIGAVLGLDNRRSLIVSFPLVFIFLGFQMGLFALGAPSVLGAFAPIMLEVYQYLRR